MAETKQKPTGEAMVTIKLPRVKGEDAVWASVNEKTYLIKRGVEVEVPESVAFVLEQSEHQKEKFIDFVEAHSTD